MNGRHVATSGQTNEYPAHKDRHGEDPARFLESNQLMATARIAGIRDPDLLRAYERVATEITAGSYRTTILEAIAERKADLGLEADADELAEPETTTDPAPVAATDGGETVTDSATHEEIEAHDDNHDEPHPVFDVPFTPVRVPVTDDPDDAPTETHPDATALEAGRVLVVDLETEADDPSVTEYVWPAEPDADQPYVLEIHDDEAPEPTRLDLSKADLFERVRNDDPDERAADAIDVQPPTDAATGGGSE